jgi:uncharacterized protein DUF6790
MFWILALAVTLAGAAVDLATGGPLSSAGAALVLLTWIVICFYGFTTIGAGLQHILRPDRIAAYIGWAPGSGFQLELGWAEVGLGLAGIAGLWLPPVYLVGPAIVGSVLFFGAALVHARDIMTKGNLSPGNAGPVFYVDVIVPALTVVCLLLARPWRRY